MPPPRQVASLPRKALEGAPTKTRERKQAPPGEVVEGASGMMRKGRSPDSRSQLRDSPGVILRGVKETGYPCRVLAMGMWVTRYTAFPYAPVGVLKPLWQGDTAQVGNTVDLLGIHPCRLSLAQAPCPPPTTMTGLGQQGLPAAWID